ncbi:MAG: hypothetical protein IJU10_02540 [Clostridia bacterium]|nr:hypothetical protein [Clostridia bacterium]
MIGDIALIAGIGLGVVVGTIGLICGVKGKKGGWAVFAIALVFCFIGWIVVGYVLWFICYPVTIIFIIIIMLVRSIVAIRKMYGRKRKRAATIWLVADLVICSLLCAIAFVFMLSDKRDDILVWVIRLFLR